MKDFKSFLEGNKITGEEFAKKTAEEMASLHNEFNDVFRKEISALVEAKASKEEIESVKTALISAQEVQLKSLNEALKSQGLAIAKLTAQEKAEGKGVLGSVRKGLEDNKEKLEALKNGDRNANFNFKAAGDMLISTNISGGNVPVEQRLAGVNAIASRRTRLLDIVSRGVATSNVISWVYQANKDGVAGGTAEGVTKNQIDFDLVVTSESVKKRTAYIKVSDEMIGDIDFMESEIRNELLRELLKDVEAQVYEGDGIGSNLNGVKTTATAFAGGTFAGTIDNANSIDVLFVAANQIMIAEHDAPNYILMHPSDVTALKVVKVTSTDKRYVDRLAMVAGNLSLDGIPIVATTLVSQDEYLIGAFDMATVYDKGEVSIEVALDGNDFTKNMRTVRAEWRGLVVVKNNDRTAFVTGTFSTDAAVLETP